MTRRWIALAVALTVAARLILDVCVHVPTRVDGLNLAQLGTLISLAVFGAAALSGAARLPRLAVVISVGWAVLLAVGWCRSGAHGASAAWLRYSSGPLVALAVAATWRDETRRVWSMATVLFGGAVAMFAIARMGADGWVQLHDTWRYVGPFDNLHALALSMGLVVGVATVVGLDASRPVSGRATAGCVAVLAFVPLAASATRSGVVFAASIVAVSLLARGRWRWAALGVAVTVAVTLAVPGLRQRSTELVLAVVGVAPEEGWVWLGTGRIAIWTRSLTAFRELEGVDQALGMGGAGYELFWKGKEPHSEYLALLYQFGVPGPVWFVVTAGTALRGLWRGRAKPVAPLLIALVVATLLTSAIGSTLLVRLTVSWAFWVAVGCGWAWSAESPRAFGHRDTGFGHAHVPPS